jgi:hypothetical protein
VRVIRTHSLAATIFWLGFASLGAQPRVSVEGVWRITERITRGGNPRADGVEVWQNNPRPSLLIFTNRYYSEIIEMGGAARSDVAAPADPQHLTDAEKIARYDQWRPFTANAGTYEISGSTLIRNPIVAKNAAVMTRGPVVSFEIRVDGPNTIWLIPTGDSAKTEPRNKLSRLE